MRTQQEEAHTHRVRKREEKEITIRRSRHGWGYSTETRSCKHRSRVKARLNVGMALEQTTDKHHHTRGQLHNWPPPLPLSSEDPIIYKIKERKLVN